MKKFFEKNGRFFVGSDFITNMRSRLKPPVVSQVSGRDYHVYTDMTGGHEVLVLSSPNTEVFGKTWEIIGRPGFEEVVRSFIKNITKEEIMRNRLVNTSDLSLWKTAGKIPTGTYGYTKAVENLCVGANKRIAKKASSIIKRAVKKDENVLSFLSLHAKRASSLPAKILLKAYKDSIPKLASKIACEGDISCPACDSGVCIGEVSPEEFEVMEISAKKEAASVQLLSQKIQNLFSKFNWRMSKATWDKEKNKLIKDPSLQLRNPREIDLQMAKLIRERKVEFSGGNYMWKQQFRTASERIYGMYGFLQKTASLALGACSELRMEAGHVASNLHMKKADLYEPITGFLSSHGKNTRCASSKLLLSVYPEQNMFRMAKEASFSTDEWISYDPEP